MIACGDRLSDSGAALQPCHVAAQYGHTAALYHLVLRWNCDFNALDNDQRSPLHWASYKGYHDLVRLLLVLGCDPHAQDSEGCNALHWAAVRGCSEAATILLQARLHLERAHCSSATEAMQLDLRLGTCFDLSST